MIAKTGRDATSCLDRKHAPEPQRAVTLSHQGRYWGNAEDRRAQSFSALQTIKLPVFLSGMWPSRGWKMAWPG